MYAVGIRTAQGHVISHAIANTMAHLCQRAGFDVGLQQCTLTDKNHFNPPAFTLSANVAKVLAACGWGQALGQAAYEPDRHQTRIAASGFLLAEMPLGHFAQERYGAPLLNIAAQDLLALCNHTAPMPSTEPAVWIDATPQPSPASTHAIYTATLTQPPQRANITWLNHLAVAWQASTHDKTTYTFAVPQAQKPTDYAWHGSLADAVAAANHTANASLLHNTVREQWYFNHEVFLGSSCYAPHPVRPETLLLGLEDAWVLSRMLENYEEAINEGLSEYAKFRAPRARKIERSNNLLAQAYFTTNPMQRTLRNLGIAFRGRFLPEMAMQRQDWIYQYDCIRGFH